MKQGQLNREKIHVWKNTLLFCLFYFDRLPSFSSKHMVVMSHLQTVVLHSSRNNFLKLHKSPLIMRFMSYLDVYK